MSDALPRPLRLALDATPLLEMRPTGVARAFRGWLAGLLEHPHPLRLTLFVPGPGEIGFDHEHADVVRLAGGPGFRWRRLPEELACRRPHIFHSPFMAVPPRCGIPRVATVHEAPDLGMIRTEGPGRTLRQAAWWALARRTADGLVAVSEFTGRRAMLRGWRARPMVVAPHGVCVDARAPAGFPRAGPVVAIGTLRRKKGMSLALAVHARLVAAGGAGAARPWIWFGAGRPPSVPPVGFQFPGFRGDAEIRETLHRASCLIMPSLTEGFGLPVLEAMAAGCPVVVADAGALPETAGRAGWVVSSREAQDWAGVVQRVIRGDDEVRARVECGWARAARFTWKRTANRLLRLYRDVLSSSAEGSSP